MEGIRTMDTYAREVSKAGRSPTCEVNQQQPVTTTKQYEMHTTHTTYVFTQGEYANDGHVT